MKYLFYNQEVDILKFNSRNEFDDFIKNQNLNYLTIVDEYNEVCVLVKILDLVNESSNFWFYSTENNKDAKILFSNIQSSLVFLIGNEIVGLGNSYSDIRFNLKLSTKVVSVIEDWKNESMLVIGEGEVVNIDRNGNLQWEMQTDLIESYKVTHNSIELHFFDNKPIVLDRLTGKII